MRTSSFALVCINRCKLFHSGRVFARACGRYAGPVTGLLISPREVRASEPAAARAARDERALWLDREPLRAAESRGAALKAVRVSDAAEASGAESVPWVIIAAVVAVVMPAGTRIRSVVELGAPGLNIWGMEGRRDHFGSHRVR